MKVLIITPLFPPDTGAPAPYSKLLAKRLAKHDVIVLAHGTLPETVPHATIISIPKNSLKTILIAKTLRQLFLVKTDLIVVNNGPAVELPMLIYSFFAKTPFILIESDPISLSHSQTGLRALVHRNLRKRARGVLQLPTHESDYLPLEILPFRKIDTACQAAQDAWWNEHCKQIESYGS
ncbi:hypothetical protein KC902_02200 [Candidatus Kaiserbacteria bacterium]|nr:hypothetical protein [Candidatus Kaiserbacteria bacterium]